MRGEFRALGHVASKQALHSECIWLNLIDLQFWNREKLMKNHEKLMKKREILPKNREIANGTRLLAHRKNTGVPLSLIFAYPFERSP